MSPLPAQRIQRRAALAAVALLTAALAWSLAFSPDITVLHQRAHTPWIGAPERPSTDTVAHATGRAPVVTFRRDLVWPNDRDHLRLRVHALRGVEVRWQGEVVALRAADAGSWKRALPVELARPAAEAARLEIRVRNPRGPALLRVESDHPALRSDAAWEVTRGDSPAAGAASDQTLGSTPAGAAWHERLGEVPAADATGRYAGSPRSAAVAARWQRAVRADDRQRAAGAIPVPSLWQVLRARGTELAALYLLAWGAAWALARPAAAPLRAALGRALLPGLALLWLSLYGAVWSRLPAYAGFDGPDHLAYVHSLVEQRALPDPRGGAMMYHPPLFYAVSAALLALVGAGAAAEPWLLRVVPLLCGLVQIGIAWRLGRLLFAGDLARARIAAACAALLPMNLAMGAYLSNESLHAALAALAAWCVVEALMATGPRPLRWLAASVALGLSVLAKISTVIWIPLLSLFLAARRGLVDRARGARGLLEAGAAGAIALLVCGGYLLRNQRLFGRPLVGNWDLPGSAVEWWQHPGFHTSSYYTHFGAALYRPFFAGFESFWDGLYSTFWGDGLIGGIASWRLRHTAWSWEWMEIGYALALPVTLAGLIGALSLLRRAFRAPALRERLALSWLAALAVTSGFSLLLVTMRIPAYSMAKASYLLSLTPVFALCLAHGLCQVDEQVARLAGVPGQIACAAWRGVALTLATSIALAFSGLGGA